MCKVKRASVVDAITFLNIKKIVLRILVCIKSKQQKNYNRGWSPKRTGIKFAQTSRSCANDTEMYLGGLELVNQIIIWEDTKDVLPTRMGAEWIDIRATH